MTADWPEELTHRIRPAGLELVTLIRQQPTAEGRAAAITSYVNSTFLPSLPKQHRAQGLGMLIVGLALDFAAILDESNDAAQVFMRHALATAAKPLG